MIRSFRSKSLRHLYTGNPKFVEAALRRKVENILFLLSAATSAEAMNLPSLGLHKLKGDRKGSWSVIVSGNWRIVFRFENGDAYDVELLDYH